VWHLALAVPVRDAIDSAELRCGSRTAARLIGAMTCAGALSEGVVASISRIAFGSAPGEGQERRVARGVAANGTAVVGRVVR